jgi:DNA-directed RNA polymerase beta subunit
VDIIPHQQNRRVRTVGEQLYAQFGVVRMARTIRGMYEHSYNEVFTPTVIQCSKALSSVINLLWNELTSYLNLDQTNPLGQRLRTNAVCRF